MLFQALTDQLPFADESWHRGERPRLIDVRELAPDTPPDLAELCRALLSADPSLRPSCGAIRAALDPPVPAAAAGPAPARELVVRAAELALLRGAFLQARIGPGLVFLIEGPPGAGKSRLLDAFCADVEAASGALVLRGQCSERETLRYRGVDGVIDALVTALRRRPELRMPAGFGFLCELFPVLRAAGGLAAEGDCDERERLSRAVAALREVLAALAERSPLLIAIEDLHCADGEAVRLLAELLEPAPPLLVVATARQDPEKRSGAVHTFRSLATCDLEQLTLQAD